MIKEIDILKNLNCEIPLTLKRMLNDEEFYLKCVSETLSSPSFEILGKYLEQGNIKDAFEIAHDLKGSLLNTGLTPLAEITGKIVEDLRIETISDVKNKYNKLLISLEEFKNALNI